MTRLKIPTPGGWETVYPPPVVTTLPTSPQDGDEVYYQPPIEGNPTSWTTDAVKWHLRYRAAQNVWDYLGGNRFVATDNSSSPIGTGWLAATPWIGGTVGVGALLPGNYVAHIACRFTSTAAALCSLTLATATSQAGPWTQVTSASGYPTLALSPQALAGFLTHPDLAFAISAQCTVGLWVNSAAAGVTITARTIALRPVLINGQ